MTITDGFIKRAARDFKKIAQEDVEVEGIRETVYVFGSELAVLRIYAHYVKRLVSTDKVRHAYSINRKSWYFSLDTNAN